MRTDQVERYLILVIVRKLMFQTDVSWDCNPEESTHSLIVHLQILTRNMCYCVKIEIRVQIYISIRIYFYSD